MEGYQSQVSAFFHCNDYRGIDHHSSVCEDLPVLLFLARPWSRQCGRRAIRLLSVCKRFFLIALFVLLFIGFITAYSDQDQRT